MEICTHYTHTKIPYIRKIYIGRATELGHKNIHLISGNVKRGNWEMLNTSLDDAQNDWRRNDQRIAARNAEIVAHAKHQKDGLESFKKALAKLKPDN